MHGTLNEQILSIKIWAKVSVNMITSFHSILHQMCEFSSYWRKFLSLQ